MKTLSEEILDLTHISLSDPVSIFLSLFSAQPFLSHTFREYWGGSEDFEARKSCFELFAKHFKTLKCRQGTSVLLTFNLRLI